MPSNFPSNVEQVPGLTSISGSVATFNDGSTRPIDDVIFCTGYHYRFDFLPPGSVRVDDDEVVSPLYKHMISINHPQSLFFIGIPKTICPFPIFDMQMRVIAGILQRRITLPPRDVMLAEEQSELQERLSSGMPRRYAHTMANRQWQYLDDLAEMGDFEKVPRFVEKLYNAVHTERRVDAKLYKQKNYEIVSNSVFKAVG